ncbi:hypothetical protein [Yinghuangia seranimata]|uniref:hypothetical protein n=1 Tax=Yinghuangia seranimata TaxID=408067 RepID=UPI00248C7066|nr:hypothetical protein [Yinghuangia seranimata]MDI2132866.1 hypothetical protein [Yinghuangia seranimata]
MLLARTMGAAGAVLLAASVLPGLARADEPAPTLILDPTSAGLRVGAKVKASAPCAAGSIGYNLVITGPHGLGGLYSDALPADLVPNPGTQVGAIPFFDMDSDPPADGETYVLQVNCMGADGAATKLASVDLKVVGTKWELQGGATTPAGPTASVNPTTAKPGDLVSVTLAGFGVNEFVTRTLRPATGSTPAPVNLPDQAVNQDGGSTALAKIPDDQPDGEYVIDFEGPDTGRKAHVSITVARATTPPTSQPPTSQPPTSQPPTSQPPTSQPPTSQPPTSQPPTSEPPTSQSPTATATATDTATATATTGDSSGGSTSGGNNNSGGGGLAHTGALLDPRLLGTAGVALMGGSALVWYRTRRRSALLEGDDQL